MVVWVVETITEDGKVEGIDGDIRTLFCVTDSKENAFECCVSSGLTQVFAGWHWVITPWALNNENGRGEEEHWLKNLSEQCDRYGNTKDMAKRQRIMDLKEYNRLKQKLGM